MRRNILSSPFHAVSSAANAESECTLSNHMYYKMKLTYSIEVTASFCSLTCITKNAVFWDVTLCGPCKNRRSGGVTTQKTVFFIVTAVRTSILQRISCLMLAMWGAFRIIFRYEVVRINNVDADESFEVISLLVTNENSEWKKIRAPGIQSNRHRAMSLSI
jgi:hypothetical protein